MITYIFLVSTYKKKVYGKKKLTASRNHAEDEAYLSSVVFASYFILLFIVRGRCLLSEDMLTHQISTLSLCLSVNAGVRYNAVR